MNPVSGVFPAQVSRDALLDAELLRVFLMEAHGILDNLAAALALARSQAGNMAPLAELRRGFHALKSSSCMVGLHVWGAALAVLEEFMKFWLAHGAHDDTCRYAVLEQAQSELQAWTAELAAQGTSARRPEALIAAVKAALPRSNADSPAGADVHAACIALASNEENDDVLDPEVLEVFLEEGRDLLWQIGDDLQRLHKAPADAILLQSLLRTMHTIKGSARMAGAMKLGSHMHALEGRIGDMALAGQLSVAMIDELLARYDHGLQLFEALRVWPAPASCDGVLPPLAAASDTAGAAPAFDTEGGRNGAATPSVRIRAGILDNLLNQAGEISISSSALGVEVAKLQEGLLALAGNVARLGTQLRQIEIQAEIKIVASNHKAASQQRFDPLEFDRYTQLQELTRMLAENVDDIVSLQKTLCATVNETQNHLARQGSLTRKMQCELMHARMVQFNDVEDRLQRLVRQMSKETGKPLVLEIVGGNVEIDRSILEKMVGPFEHLLRNAVVHGIETAAERCRAGKQTTGRLRLEITQEGNEAMIRLVDDGQGLKLHRIRATALRQGLIVEGQRLSEAELTGFIFHPGFTTSTTVTTIAGRGVGLDVVRSEVASLSGRIRVDSIAGHGTAFIIHLPLSLAVTQVVLLQTGTHTYAIPSLLVEQVVRMKSAEQEQLLRTGSMEWQGRRLALHGLPDLLGSEEGIVMHCGMPVLVIRSGHDFIALLAERVLGSREVVTKNIGPQLEHFVGVIGATVLGNGSLVLILNPIQLAQRQGYRRQLRRVEPQVQAPVSSQKMIMVVDDSLTVRRVMQRLLTRAGYQVVLAADGMDALQRLSSLKVDVILIDIEMPRMDGFDLTRRLRDMAATATLPIIMITSRTAAKHRERAMELGINEYLGKPYQDDVLLKLIAALIGADGVRPACRVDEVLFAPLDDSLDPGAGDGIKTS